VADLFTAVDSTETVMTREEASGAPVRVRAACEAFVQGREGLSQGIRTATSSASHVAALVWILLDLFAQAIHCLKGGFEVRRVVACRPSMSAPLPSNGLSDEEKAWLFRATAGLVPVLATLRQLVINAIAALDREVKTTSHLVLVRTYVDYLINATAALRASVGGSDRHPLEHPLIFSEAADTTGE
jgi:hypothetical protein